jgi:hypothetical protein
LKNKTDSTTLALLNNLNNIKILSIYDDQFKVFGKIIANYDFKELLLFMDNETSIPETENTYIASVDAMEKTEIYNSLKTNFFGSMDIQIGYCNGKNSTYNGFEYHKCSEINIAATNFMLVLGHVWDINNNNYNIEHAKVFYVPKGCAIEIYQTTLHLSPCKVDDMGFKDIVILQRGTNTPLSAKVDIIDSEDVLLLQKNKWVIAHELREPLVKQGAHIGIIGENKELFYK